MAGYKRKTKTASSKPKKDMREELTKFFIDEIKSGVVPWSKGRIELGAGVPTNFNTGKRYRGINALNLMVTGLVNKTTSGYFVTYNQAIAIAGVDKKDPDLKEKSPLTGQKAVAQVEYWGSITKDQDGKTWFKYENGKKRTQPTPAEIRAEKLKQVFFVRYASVFSFEQMNVDKIPEPWLDRRNMNDKTINKDIIAGKSDLILQENALKMVKGLGVEVVHDKYVDTPHYLPVSDKIVMPPRENYESDARYYSTLMHEAGHATGHPSRLNRDSLKDYSVSDENRAYEELVAELTGVFMGLELGIKTVSSADLGGHASYLKSWGRLLSDDLASGSCKVLAKASSDAEKAVDILLNGLEQKLEIKKEKAPEEPMLGM